MSQKKPNVLFVFADQMRAQATGYAGDPNVITPNLNALAAASVNFTTAVSGCPVCCPARASLITGTYPLTHGVFINDVHLTDERASIAQAFKAGGYHTGYVGKWHLEGGNRDAFIPPEHQQGFDFWHARECTHNYWDAFYYDKEDERKVWPGYDAEAQTRDAQDYIKSHAQDESPFLLMLSWGPPHDPYLTAPEKYKQMYDPAKLELPANMPVKDAADEARKRERLAGYYAHITALDDFMGQLLATLEEQGIADDTIVVYWSDHGDMVGSRDQWNKQRPWDESILVPLLVRLPSTFGVSAKQLPAPINTPDLLPTLLELCSLDVPDTVEGKSYAGYIQGKADAPEDAALIACYWPFSQYRRQDGGREFRGVRTERYTFARDLAGPWLLYDNKVDPYQLTNLINSPQHADIQQQLDAKLTQLLQEQGDTFEHGQVYIDRWGYTVDANGAAPYR